MEDRIGQLEEALRTMATSLQQAEGREQQLTVEVQRLGQVAQAPPPPATPAAAQRTGVDTRTLGKPDTYHGEEAKWQDWKTVLMAYTGRPLLDPNS